jgi:RNA polymerase sigma factor (sigma-70 family)
VLTRPTTATRRDGVREADAALVRLARSGDAGAWERLVERHNGLLWWIARQFRLSTDDAADVVQITWLRCLEHLDQLDDVEALGGWLATICRRECLRTVGRRGHEVLVAEVDEEPRVWAGAGRPAPDPYDEIARRDERERLQQAIDDLPPRPRSVLAAMLTAEGSGYVEIARRLGVPVGSLGPTRNRALARLREDPRLALADC